MPVARINSEHLVVWMYAVVAHGIDVRTKSGQLPISTPVPPALRETVPHAIRGAIARGFGVLRGTPGRLRFVPLQANVKQIVWAARLLFPVDYDEKLLYVGVPTAYDAPVFRDIFPSNEAGTLVWRSRRSSPFSWVGSHDRAGARPVVVRPTRGISVQPMHRNAHQLAAQSHALYDLLAALDMARLRSARAQTVGRQVLDMLLQPAPLQLQLMDFGKGRTV